MNIHVTYGDVTELKAIKESLTTEQLVLMELGNEAVLIHENEGSAGFAEADSYTVLDASGEITNGNYAVFNNIPVTTEGRELFEQRFMGRARQIEDTEGFSAIRVLRPLESDTYVILTKWQDEASFKAWQNSQAYANAHKKRGTEEGIDKKPNIFSRPSFVTTYQKVD
ncbi:antibiotic biosynthesis monooxygenase [Sporosarcina sp. BI001-red]|uniref:antibiotic biosynthesis monooxygenase family protein n=1 Tax=Sporosarcina sp. BI001-red TaxID=2282866 RepID=UPI000E279129|nr:antibiotic biosynthesis monooxygenase [Sporosarcina sp. BI001-red]REB10145.1 antibiotic biosynthesis monooxygenase [Sporosarcina sp. BI001-red]